VKWLITYALLTKATFNQNIIAWHNLLRGLISKHWITLQQIAMKHSTQDKRQRRWDLQVVSLLIIFHSKVWEDGNMFIHGKTVSYKEKIRQAVEQKVTQLYSNQS
jgi:hypothetical protein